MLEVFIRPNHSHEMDPLSFLLFNKGMIDILSMIWYVFRDESLSYVCFCSLISGYMNLHFDRYEEEFSRRTRLFHSILSSIDSQLYELFQKDQNMSCLHYLSRCFLFDCQREFSTWSQTLRVIELVWLYSMPCFSKTFVTGNDQSLFTVLLSIAILEEDQVHSSVSPFEIRPTRNSARSFSSMERILQRAQLCHSIYSSSLSDLSRRI